MAKRQPYTIQKEVSRNITEIMYRLYKEDNLSMPEISQLFSISRQRVEQRFREFGYRSRPCTNNDNHIKTPQWQINLHRKLVNEVGCTIAQANSLLGINLGTKTKVRRTYLYSGISYGFRTPHLNLVYYNIKEIVLINAWREGATIKDLSLIFGTTTVAMRAWMQRLRDYNNRSLKKKFK